MGAIDFAGEVEQHRNRFRRIEVVVHRGAEPGSRSILPLHAGFSHVHPAQCGIKTRQRLLRVVQMRIGIIERAAVVRAQDEETQYLRIVFLQHLAYGEEVAQRFGHLLLVHPHETVVHPVVHVGTAVRALGLRDLVLVMRELQILPAAVNIEMMAQMVVAHCRALDVPAGSAGPPG